jgi:hypothetical protein
MGEMLSIIAIVGLLILVAFSLAKQRGGMSRAKAEEDVRTAGANVQRDRSIRRRAESNAEAKARRVA